ncbi:hypothetical protein A3850_009920 [Lewinella sp. 4G2]|nr:hypothetical protein A3850_009920 [Lewinella sp. 4G2]
MAVFFSIGLQAQGFSITTEVTDATCSANGRVDITVTGGSGSFQYDLTGDCGPDFQSLDEAFFTSLPPCTYLLSVTDRVSSMTATATVVVGSANELLSVATEFSGCDAVVSIEGGLPPYNVSYTNDGANEVDTMLSASLTIGEIGDARIDGTVIDDCGNSRRFTLDGRTTAVSRIGIDQEADSIRVTFQGGVGPFTYVLTSTLGSFTSATGRFPYEEVGCSASVSIRGACPNAERVEDITLESRVGLNCVNYEEGTATVFVDPPGVQPYTFTVEAAGQTITSNSTRISGIPAGATSLMVTATDGCGEEIPGAVNTTPLRIITPEALDACNANELSILAGRTCAGDNKYPIEITCESCPGSPSLSQTEDGQILTFMAGTDVGNYVISFEDGCGDRQRCTDSILLEVVPACDSLIANVIQLFTCENGSISRSPIQDPSFVYQLRDATGSIVEASNTTGRFTNLSDGDYTVEVTGACLTTSSDVTLGVDLPIDPTIILDPTYAAQTNGSCGVRYGVEVEQSEGPYELVSLDDPSLQFYLNDFDQSACPNFNVPLLLPPGDYRLVSLSRCGEKLFTLPDLVEDRINNIDVVSTCPGATEIDVDALLRTSREWREYFADLGFRSLIRGNEGDYLFVNGRRYFGGSITNLAPGEYEVVVGLGFGQIECGIDTATVTIPAYEPVSLAVSGNYICEDGGASPLQIQPQNGNGPYSLRRIDCANTSSIISTQSLVAGDIAMVDTEGVGTYCFVVEDNCGITSDFQVEVRNLADQVRFAYDCSPAVILLADTLDGVFTWLDAEGAPVGVGNQVSVPPATEDRTFTLEVLTDICTLTAEVEVPGRAILPELAIDASDDVVQCGDDPVTVTASVDANSTLQWEGQAINEDQLSVTEPGSYRITATNDLACAVTDSVLVVRVVKPNPSIGFSELVCPGTPARFGIETTPGEMASWMPTNELTDSITVTEENNYVVTVENEAGCIGQDSILFVPPLPIEFSATPDSVSCFGQEDGALIVDGNGGTGTLTYTLVGEGRNLEAPALDLSAGTYTLMVRDENGCGRDTTITIGTPDSTALDVGPDVYAVFGDEVFLNLFNNLDSVIAISLSPLILDAELTDETIRFRGTESVDLLVTLLDTRGCPASDSVRIIVDRQLKLYAPTAFSPNGDGVNDRFTLQGTSDVATISSLRVFDRWGSQVFSATDVAPNDLGAGWDGNGPDRRPLNPATFVWQAEVVFFDGSERVFSGAVSLLR